MTVYKIEVKETLAEVVSIQASSKDEALEKVKESYRRGNIVLEYDSFVDVEFSLLNSEEEVAHD